MDCNEIRFYNGRDHQKKLTEGMVYIKKILINTIGGGAAWTGGLYYARNIAFELIQNEYIRIY